MAEEGAGPPLFAFVYNKDVDQPPLSYSLRNASKISSLLGTCPMG